MARRADRAKVMLCSAEMRQYQTAAEREGAERRKDARDTGYEIRQKKRSERRESVVLS